MRALENVTDYSGSASCFLVPRSAEAAAKYKTAVQCLFPLTTQGLRSRAEPLASATLQRKVSYGLQSNQWCLQPVCANKVQCVDQKC